MADDRSEFVITNLVLSKADGSGQTGVKRAAKVEGLNRFGADELSVEQEADVPDLNVLVLFLEFQLLQEDVHVHADFDFHVVETGCKEAVFAEAVANLPNRFVFGLRRGRGGGAELRCGRNRGNRCWARSVRCGRGGGRRDEDCGCWRQRRIGRGGGCGRGRVGVLVGVAVAVGVGDGSRVGAAVAVARTTPPGVEVTVGVAVGVELPLADAVGVAVGVGVMRTSGSQVTRMLSIARKADALGLDEARWERNRSTSVSA